MKSLAGHGCYVNCLNGEGLGSIGKMQSVALKDIKYFLKAARNGYSFHYCLICLVAIVRNQICTISKLTSIDLLVSIQ